MSEPSPQPRAPRRAKAIKLSEWQQLVEDRRQELKMSTRDIAAALQPVHAKLGHTTVWAWLNHMNGVPAKAIYTNELNRHLAKVLDLKPERLALAYDNSNVHLVVADKQTASRGPLAVLRRLFADSSKETYTREEIVKLIDDIQGL